MDYRRKTLVLAFVIFIVLLWLIRFSAKAQGAQQYQIDRVCIDKKCKEKRGYIAIDNLHIYIKYDSIRTDLVAVKSFKYRQTSYYDLEHTIYSGTFFISPTTSTAFLDLQIAGCQRLTEMYYLKK